MLPSQTKFTPTPNQKVLILEHVCYEINSFLDLIKTYHPITKQNSPSDNYQLEILLLHSRVLIEFFENKKRSTYQKNGKKIENKDVLPNDFGFPARSVEIPSGYYKRMNTALAHLSYSRIDDDPEWNLSNMYLPLLKRCEEFVNHILSSQSKMLDAEKTQKWELLNKKLKETLGQEAR